MTEFVILMAIAGVVAIAPTIHYIHKAGYTIHEMHKWIHQ